MGLCCAKGSPASGVVDPSVTLPPDSRQTPFNSANGAVKLSSVRNTPARPSSNSPWPSPYPHGRAGSPLPAGVSPSPPWSSTVTLRRFFRRPFPPPSPAKHIKAALAKRRVPPVPAEGTVPEEANDGEQPLDKNFGYGKNFTAKYELGKEVGRGHFGYTCMARAKKGVIKGQFVAVKIISKAKMMTSMSIEDVRREVTILKALSGHKNLVKFHDACEDANNVYIAMEGGRYREDDAKAIVVQMLNVVAFCHLQGVVHRDLKPENFLFTTTKEDAPMKLIDFGLSEFNRSEVLHRSYSTEADMWSIGVITYVLLCGSRPFWGRTESGIFRSVLRADPNFDDAPWSDLPTAEDFVKRLLNKDYRKRMTAAQALMHPWLRDDYRPIPLDIFIYKLVKSYVRATPFKEAALKSLSKALREDELVYLHSQFKLLEPNKDGFVSLENFRTALGQNATDAMKESRVLDMLNYMDQMSYRKMDFEEFCAATVSVYQLEAHDSWEEVARTAFEHFEQEGNRVISAEELAREMKLGPTAHSILGDWIRESDGKLSFVGYTTFLHGLTLRNSETRYQYF